MDNADLLARVRAAWTARAPGWDERAEVNRAAPDRAAALARIAAALRLRPGSRVLDAGCGTGQYALDFAAMGCVATGVDLTPAMIERARTHADERGLNVTWLVGDLTAIAAPDASFDAVFARVALHLVPDPAAALREFRRLLRPDGCLLASVPGALSPIYTDAWRRFIATDVPPLNGLMPWELARLLDELGFTITEQWGEQGPDGAGRTNPYGTGELGPLPLPLQQAVATIWTIIARRP